MTQEPTEHAPDYDYVCICGNGHILFTSKQDLRNLIVDRFRGAQPPRCDFCGADSKIFGVLEVK